MYQARIATQIGSPRQALMRQLAVLVIGTITRTC